MTQPSWTASARRSRRGASRSSFSPRKPSIATPSANIFAMCERGEILDQLAAWQAGAIVVNRPDAIRNTYRYRMVELFARHHVASPASQIVAPDASNPRPALRLGQTLRFPRDAIRRRHVCGVGGGLARGIAPLRRAGHPVCRRAGACARRSGQILRRADGSGEASSPGSNGSIIATKV